jgi:hypothetical protein
VPAAPRARRVAVWREQAIDDLLAFSGRA